MSSRDEINKELKELGSVLADSHPMGTSQLDPAYFKELKERLQKIPRDQRKVGQRRLWAGVFTSAAAAVAAFFVLFQSGTVVEPVETAEPQLAFHEAMVMNELDAEDIMEFMAEEEPQLENETIEDILLEESDLVELLN